MEDARRTHGAGKGCKHGGLAVETYGLTDLASQVQSTPIDVASHPYQPEVAG